MSKAPPLRDNCFAMPRGVAWVPVADALAQLRKGLHGVVDHETVQLSSLLGRVLAEDVVAASSHPPFSNSAVDGYGYAHEAVPNEGAVSLPLFAARAAAGAPMEGALPKGQAVRILTGAALPSGVDTVILQEDVAVDDASVHFHAGLKKGANTRPRGEDITKGDMIFSKGHRLSAADIGVLASAGIADALVYKPLKIGVLSTGTELVSPDVSLKDGKIYDANRPMLLALISSWGYEAVDLGALPDVRDDIKEALDAASRNVDAILTTGGASTGDEDHISALLSEEGNLQTWRIALKPGRPLALALWQGVPVFGLPGNPVAANLCTHIFGYPAFKVLSGQKWSAPKPRLVGAAFVKSKKQGRMEYLRARLNDKGQAELFSSEGSGRISGLSWADGFVELGHNAEEIAPEDLVRFTAFSDYLI